MANGGSAMCTVSGKPQHLSTASVGVSHFYFAEGYIALLLFFHWLVTGCFVKKPAGFFSKLHQEIGIVDIMKRLNKVPLIKYMFPAIVIIHTIITLPGISFG
jgi:hypothetical protein